MVFDDYTSHNTEQLDVAGAERLLLSVAEVSKAPSIGSRHVIVGITGAGGLIGWHVRAYLRAHRPGIEVRSRRA